MPRGLPPPPPDGGTRTLGHDAIALSFFVACVAATLALASSMCSACRRKPKTAAASGSDKPAGAGSLSDGQTAGEEEDEGEVVVVTLSPEVATHGPIAPVALPSSTSKRRLSMSLSMNIPDKLRLSRRERKDHKVESEDTLWKKGIILGEKCRIPGERDDDGEGGDADELAAESFRRSSYSRPISRSSSFATHQEQDTPAARVSHS